MHARIRTSELEDCLPPLYRFALSLTKRHDQAADLVQDSVERALRKAHLFDGSNLRAWLFTVCRRVHLNQIRSENTRGVRVDLSDAPPLRIAAQGNQELSLYFREVANAMDHLPSKDKTILSLVVVDGLKYEEAASILGVPIGTIRSRLSRARAKLREMTDGAVETAPSGGTLDRSPVLKLY